jgi:hypothetical protein
MTYRRTGLMISTVVRNIHVGAGTDTGMPEQTEYELRYVGCQ